MSERFKLDEDFMYDRGYEVSYTYLGDEKISTSYEQGGLEIDVYENEDQILVNWFAMPKAIAAFEGSGLVLHGADV